MEKRVCLNCAGFKSVDLKTGIYNFCEFYRCAIASVQSCSKKENDTDKYKTIHEIFSKKKKKGTIIEQIEEDVHLSVPELETRVFDEGRRDALYSDDGDDEAADLDIVYNKEDEDAV